MTVKRRMRKVVKLAVHKRQISYAWLTDKHNPIIALKPEKS